MKYYISVSYCSLQSERNFDEAVITSAVFETIEEAYYFGNKIYNQNKSWLRPFIETPENRFCLGHTEFIFGIPAIRKTLFCQAKNDINCRVQIKVVEIDGKDWSTITNQLLSFKEDIGL
jgi:hypothetical protein